MSHEITEVDKETLISVSQRYTTKEGSLAAEKKGSDRTGQTLITWLQPCGHTGPMVTEDNNSEVVYKPELYKHSVQLEN